MLITLLFLFFKARNMKHKSYAIFVMLFIIFLYVSGSLVIKKGGINVYSFNGLIQGIKLYFSWLGSLFGNLKTMSGEAVKMEWANFSVPISG